MIKRLLNQSIYGRVLGSFAVIIVFIAAVGALGALHLDRLRGMTDQVAPLTGVILLLDKYDDTVTLLDRNVDRVVVVGEQEARIAIRNGANTLMDLVDDLKQSVSATYAEEVGRMDAASTDLSESVQALLDADTSDSRTMNRVLATIFAALESAEEAKNNLLESALAQLDATLSDQRSLARGTLVSQLLIASFAVAFAVGAALILARSIVRPVTGIAETATLIAKGDYSKRVEVKRRDEVGRLATAFNAMVSRLEARTAEREGMIKELLAAKRLAEENSRLKSEFLSTMSHELRTPMNAIEGFTSIMLNRMGGVQYNEKAERYITRVNANSKRLLQLINDFLDLSRVEAGRLELAHMPFAPRVLAQRWTDEIGVLAEKKGLHFDTIIDPELPATLIGDEEAVSKIALNLLGNAIKFTEEGAITVMLQASVGEWRIAVQDTGIGIPPHAREFIFEEFRQVDQTSKRKFGGTGLGLAIVQKYARSMGGTVSVKSEVGQGSVFTVALPMEIAPVLAEPPTSSVVMEVPA
jgi:signal transduction histidine kinase